MDRREIQPVELSGDGNQLVFFSQGEEMRSMPGTAWRRVSFSGQPRRSRRTLLDYLRPFFEGEGRYPEGSTTLKRERNGGDPGGRAAKIRKSTAGKGSPSAMRRQWGFFPHIPEREMVNGQYFLEVAQKAKAPNNAKERGKQHDSI